MEISNSRNTSNKRDASVSIDRSYCKVLSDVIATAQKFTENNMKITKNSGKCKKLVTST
jgi:hypothetical protein